MKLKKITVSLLLLSSASVFAAIPVDTRITRHSGPVLKPRPDLRVTKNLTLVSNDVFWWQRIKLSGNLNEAALFSNHTPTTQGVIPSRIGTSPAATDLVVTFANLSADATLTDWLSTVLAISYAQQSPSFIRSPAGGGNSLFLNQGYFTFANPKVSPWYVIGGRTFVDFGGLDDTSFLESPYQLLTLNRETVLSGGFKDLQGFNASIYTFRGLRRIDLINTTRINTFGATLGYAYSNQSMGFDFGAGYVSDILSGLYPSSTVAGGSTLNGGFYHTSLPAIDLHALVRFAPFDASVKYAGATRRASVLDIPFTTNGGVSFRGAEPAAWGVNVGYTFNVFSHYSSRLGVGYQGSSESVALGTASGSVANAGAGVYGAFFAIGLPQHRYYANYSINLSKWASLGFEYAHDVGYGVNNGGTGRSSDIGVAALSLKF